MLLPIFQESSDPQYPRIRVRRSWDSLSQAGEPNLSSLTCKESVRSFDASQYSDGHSISSDDNLFQLQLHDFEKNLPRSNLSPRPSGTDLDAVESDLGQGHIEQEDDEILEHGNLSEDLITDKVTPLTTIDVSPKPYPHFNASSPGTNTDTSGVTLVDNRENVNLGSSGLKGDKELNMTDLSPKPYPHFNASSPGANLNISGVTLVHNRASVDLGSSGLKRHKELNNFHRDFVVGSLGITPPWLSEKSATSFRWLKLPKSRSCKANLMMDSSSYWFDKEDMIENTPPIGIEKEFTGRPGGFQGKVCPLNYDANIAERQSRNDSANSRGSATVDEVRNVKTSIDMESDSDAPSSPERKAKEDLGNVNQLVNHKVSFFYSFFLPLNH